MKLDQAISILINNILEGPAKIVLLQDKMKELNYEKNQMLDRIILLEKQIKRKKNR